MPLVNNKRYITSNDVTSTQPFCEWKNKIITFKLHGSIGRPMHQHDQHNVIKYY